MVRFEKQASRREKQITDRLKENSVTPSMKRLHFTIVEHPDSQARTSASPLLPFFTTLLSLFTLLSCLATPLLAVAEQPQKVCIIITGLGGMPEYEENFSRWGAELEAAFQDELHYTVYRMDGRQRKKQEIFELFDRISTLPQLEELWLFLVGHGNHDGSHYKFNISGPDLTDQDLANLLDALAHTKTFLIAATSASGTLASDLSHANRVIVTATKNPRERQPPLFMSFFLEALTSAEVDTDKNQRISLLEAFHFADDRVASWYETKGRIQTEHPILDDNGQVRLAGDQPAVESAQQGTLLASVSYLSAAPEPDYHSAEAEQLASEAMAVERDIEDLKFRKDQIPESEYYDRLEKFLIRLASINERIEQLEDNR